MAPILLKRLLVPPIAEALDGYDVSSRAAAALRAVFSSTMRDSMKLII